MPRPARWAGLGTCATRPDLWQLHHQLVYLGVLTGPHRAAPTEDDTLGAESGQPEGVARPVLDIAEFRGDLENRRQPPSGDGERPQIRGITLGRVVGLPGDHGPACARAGHFHVVGGADQVWPWSMEKESQPISPWAVWVSQVAYRFPP